MIIPAIKEPYMMLRRASQDGREASDIRSSRFEMSCTCGGEHDNHDIIAAYWDRVYTWFFFVSR
jgi:hypothetical protein